MAKSARIKNPFCRQQKGILLSGKENTLNPIKALFLPFGSSLSHVSRCLAVAEAWRDRGHTAIFAAGAESVDLVQSAGFETHVLPEAPGSVVRTTKGFGWVTREYVAQNIAAERKLLADVQPDLVVFDFRFTSALSAHLAGLPSVSIAHGNLLRLAWQPRKTARHLLGDPKNVRGLNTLQLRILRWLFPIAFQLITRFAARPVNAIRKEHGLRLARSPFELLLADHVIVADIPALVPPDLPANCSIVGPLMWSGWTRPEPWLDELDTRPLIYVTMGSTVEAQSVLVKIINALRDAPYNVVVSTGSLTLSDLELPAHIRVFATVSGETVMQRSTAVVYHGGHGTLLQALKAGVPSLALPTNPDQILVAQQARALEVGHIMWHAKGLPLGNKALNEMTKSQIRHAIDGITADQDCARTCKALGREMKSYQGGTKAVTILERAATQLGRAPRSG
jgi:UDP:flavonoid glycosyltransferase YjiC (YdhE family)